MIVHLSRLLLFYVSNRVLLAGLSYRKTEWVPLRDIAALRGPLVNAFMKRLDRDGRDVRLQEGVDPEWRLAHRVIASRTRKAGGASVTQYLVKWQGLDYVDSTWENEDELEERDKVRRSEALGMHAWHSGWMSSCYCETRRQLFHKHPLDCNPSGCHRFPHFRQHLKRHGYSAAAAMLCRNLVIYDPTSGYPYVLRLK